MTRYLFEFQLTPQAFAALMKAPQDRAQALRPLTEAAGGKLEGYYFAVGSSTAYVLGYYPDEVTAEAAAMIVLAGGAVASIKGTAILTSAEAVEAMKKAAKLAYKPPSA